MRRSVLAAALAAAVAASPAGAHGVGSRSLGAGARTAELCYASGEAMAYAAARLFAPSGPGTPFIDGRADQLDRFAFLPSKPGA